MKLYEAKEIIQNVFENSFNKDRYTYFVKNLLKNFEEKPFPKPYSGTYIPRAFNNYIQQLDRIGKFEDDERNSIDILVVELKREHSIEYARSAQRNFIRWYLSGSRGGKMKDAALVAFHTERSTEWRFSLIKMQYSLKTKKDEYTPAKRFSFMVGEKGKSHTAKQQLVKVLQNDDTPLLDDLEQAFNIETVTNEFFERYKQLVLNLVEELEKIIKRDKTVKKEFDEKNIVVIDFAKKLMGQIVFLYFLQRKGWLGLKNGEKYGEGDRNFLRSLYDMKQKGENFFNDYLEFLFYEALSKKRVTDEYKRFNCRIPFLNGGLFDPIGFYDWDKTDIVIPDKLFTNNNQTKEGDPGDGILDIFDLYNFTVNEAEPLEKEVAVDPEMLGKVFERMLDVKERKSKGAFYTPREIVHYMSQESLIHYLDTALNSSSAAYEEIGKEQTQMFDNETKTGQAELLVEHGKETIVPREDIETLIKHGEQFIERDTAILEGKLKEEANKFELPKTIHKKAKLIDEKLRDIRVCDPAVGSGAFPVGVMTEIVKARSILFRIQNPGKEPSHYEFKNHAIHHCLYGVDIDASAVEICKLRLWLSLVVDEQRIDTIEPLPNLDYKIVRGNSLINMPDDVTRSDKLEKEIEKLMNKFYAETDKDAKRELKEEIDNKIKKLFESVEQFTNYKIDFDFRLYFHEVFKEKYGFDVVIGNPPYVQLQDKSKITKQFLNDLESQNYNTFNKAGDIYCMFYEKGIKICNHFGYTVFISSNRFCFTNYGKTTRRFLSHYKIHRAINLNKFNVFDAANVGTLILAVIKAKRNKNCIELADLNNFNDFSNFGVKIQKSFQKVKASHFNEQQWSFYSNEILDVKQKLQNNSIALSKNKDLKINRGITTGLNHVFIIKDKLKNKLIQEDPNSKEIIKPVLKGADVKRWIVMPNSNYLIYTYTNIKIKRYPAIYEYLSNHKKELSNVYEAKRGQKKWYELRKCKYYDSFNEQKLIWTRLSNKNSFALSENSEFSVDSTSFAIGKNLKYYCALLNSSIIYFYFVLGGVIWGKDGIKWFGDYFDNIPLKIPDHRKTIIEYLVDYLILLFNNISSYKIKEKYFEQLVDGMVFELYFEEEVKKVGCEIIKYLEDLTPIKKSMSNKKKMEIITEAYKKLSNPKSIVYKNLKAMDEIEEVRIRDYNTGVSIHPAFGGTLNARIIFAAS
jgi:hypothetical protein